MSIAPPALVGSFAALARHCAGGVKTLTPGRDELQEWRSRGLSLVCASQICCVDGSRSVRMREPGMQIGNPGKLAAHNFSDSGQKHAGMLGMGFISRAEFTRQESFLLAGLAVETEPQDDKGQESADFADDEGRAQQAH